MGLVEGRRRSRPVSEESKNFRAGEQKSFSESKSAMLFAWSAGKNWEEISSFQENNLFGHRLIKLQEAGKNKEWMRTHHYIYVLEIVNVGVLTARLLV